MNILVVVLEELPLLLRCERADGFRKVTLGIFTADHEADLARGVGWDGRIGVLNTWEYLLAVLLELGDQWKMKPLILGCEGS